MLDGELFEFEHLNDYHLVAQDSEGLERHIAVVFSDHCFTDKEAEDPESPQRFVYPQSSRKPGYFCQRRYMHSLSIVQHIENAKEKSIWNASGQNLAIIPIVQDNGAPAHYAVLFSLRKWKGTPPYHLRMDIVSAYICDDLLQIATFGHIGFKKLVSLAMKNEQPKKNHSRRRKRPK